MKKLFLCDIDGTIIDGSRKMYEVSNKTIYAMQELSKDNYVFIASGRCMGLIEEGIRSLPVNGFILCNGAYCEINGKEIFADYFDQKTVERIIDVTKKYDGFYVLESLNHMFVNDLRSEHFIKFLNGWGKSIELFKEGRSLSNKYLVAMLGFKDGDIWPKINKEMGSYTEVLKHNGTNSCDINIKGINKGTAVKRIIDYLDLDIEDTYCFGDGINDLEMLQAVGHPVVMANCTEELKHYDFDRTLDVLDDGFYDYLVKNNLIKPL